MFDVNKAIYACDDVICRNIESFTTEQRGLLSQNILSQLRNFVENIFVKVYISLGGEPQRKYNPQIQISAESETKRSIFREKDKTKRSKKESAQHSKSRNKSFVMTSVSAL